MRLLLIAALLPLPYRSQTAGLCVVQHDEPNTCNSRRDPKVALQSEPAPRIAAWRAWDYIRTIVSYSRRFASYAMPNVNAITAPLSIVSFYAILCVLQCATLRRSERLRIARDVRRVVDYTAPWAGPKHSFSGDDRFSETAFSCCQLAIEQP